MKGFESTVRLTEGQQAHDATATLFVQLSEQPIDGPMVLRHSTIRMLLALLTATPMNWVVMG